MSFYPKNAELYNTYPAPELKHKMLNVVSRSGGFLAAFPTKKQAEDYLDQISSIALVDIHGFKYRIHSVSVAMSFPKENQDDD